MSQLDPQHAVYAGSFDPFTLGHEDIVQRGARVFSRVTIGIGINPDKRPLFEPQERVDLVKRATSDLPNVTVQSFEGLAVDFLKSVNAGVMLRGIRSLSDIEAEFTMTLANHALSPEIETVFLMASEKYTHVSSTLIKQIAQMGGEAHYDQLSQFVPETIIKPLLAKYQR